MRRFAWGGTAPLLLLLPSLGYALALGNISVQSALNEPFQADIKLTSISAGELDSARIKLASRDDFKRAGIQHAAVLSDLRFNIVERAGKSTLEVTSIAPVRDPFLDFLVEVVTRKGRMVRQYTVLIDPPELPAGFRPTPVAAPQVAPRSTGTIRRVEPTPLVIAARSGITRSAGQPTSSGRSGRTSAPQPTAGGASYGPTRRNDTLWDIARQNRPSKSVSMNQMMMALLRANPQAFRNNNVNNLKAGQTLTIPQQGEITQLSPEQAKNAFQQQYRDWKAGVASAPPPQVERQVVSESLRADAARVKAPAAATDSGELVLVAPREDDEKLADASNAAVDGSAQPGAAAGGASDEAGGGVEDLRRQRDLAQEQAYTAAQESRELLRRTDELEGRLAELERALKLRDADIAAMQQRAVEQAEEAAAGMSGMSGAAAPEVGVSDSAGAGMDADTGAVADDAEGVPASEAADDAAADVADIPITPAATPLDMITENWERVAAVVGLLGVGGLGIFLTRRRRRDDDDLSNFDGSDEVEMPKVTGGDVITEVNQYLAYGRPQQAEERLKQAIIAAPARIELPIKLLEVYSRTGNKEAFDALAGEVFGRMGKNSVSADWQRIAGMGRRLSPNNPLYAPIGGNIDADAMAAARPPPVPKPAPAPSVTAAGMAAAGAGAASFAAAKAVEVDDDGPAFDELEQELRRLEMEIGAAVAEEDALGTETRAAVAGSDTAADASSGVASNDDDMDFDLSFDDLEQMDSPKVSTLADATRSDASDDVDDGVLEFDWGTDDDSDADDAADDLSSVLDSSFGEPADTDLAFDSIETADTGNAGVVHGGPPQADLSLGFEDVDDADVSLSFDDMVDLEVELEQPAESVLVDDILSFDDIADDSDSLSFDDVTEVGGDAAASSDDSDQGLVDLGDFGGDDLELGSFSADADMEELTTKLDLARAYVDMEDRDSAIDILDEVLKDASGTVRSEAEALRKQLG